MAGEKALKKLLVTAQPEPLMETSFGAFALGQPPLECHSLACSNAMPIAMAMPMAMPMASGALPQVGEARMASVARESVLACALPM